MIYVSMWIVGIVCSEMDYVPTIFWCFLFSFHLFAIIATLIVVVGCKYVVKYNVIDTAFTRVNSTKLRSPSTAEADIIINDILNNVDTIHLFMIHLSNEYSIECLLSFIEFWQYIEYLKVNIRNKLETKEITDND